MTAKDEAVCVAEFADQLAVDLRYAMRQLLEFRDIRRAMDALERIQDTIDSAVQDATEG